MSSVYAAENGPVTSQHLAISALLASSVVASGKAEMNRDVACRDHPSNQNLVKCLTPNTRVQCGKVAPSRSYI